MEKKKEQPVIKRYLARAEPFFGILYDRCRKSYRFIPSSEVEAWRLRDDADFFDYSRLDLDNPRTAFGAPMLLFLDITARCQCECWFCYNNSGTILQNELTSAEIFSIIREYASLGGIELRLSGGEPTLHPDLPAFLELAGQLGLRTILVSNGMIATDVLERLSELPVAAYYFSLQGDQAGHDAVRGPGSYERCLSSTSALIAAGAKVRLAMVFHKRNQQYVEHVVRVASSLGASAAFNPLRPFGRASQADMLDPEEHRRLVDLVMDLQQRYPGTRIDTPWSYLSGSPMAGQADAFKRLGCGGNSLSISASGDCYSCGQIMGYPEFRLGNIRQESLQQIWLCSRRTCALANAELAEKCQTCAYLYGSACFGGCAATAWVVRGSLSAGDPYCFVDLL